MILSTTGRQMFRLIPLDLEGFVPRLRKWLRVAWPSGKRYKSFGTVDNLQMIQGFSPQVDSHINQNSLLHKVRTVLKILYIPIKR